MIFYYWYHRLQNSAGYAEYNCVEWWMIYRRRGYYRKIKTTQERKRWFKDIDENAKWRKGSRNPSFLDQWGILESEPSCLTSKSWKKLYKVRHQWEKPKKKYYF